MNLVALDPENLPAYKLGEWKYTNLSNSISQSLVQDESQEIVIHKNCGEICEQVENILLTGEDGKIHTPHLKNILEDGAKLTLVERQDGKGSYWKNMITEIEVGANARLNHIRFQEDSAEGVNTNLVKIKLSRDSFYDGFALNIGSKLMKHEIHALIEGENAEVHFNAINLFNERQHGDTTILIEHKAQHTTSRQFIRNLLDDSAQGVFRGKILVRESAQKTDASQLINSILISHDAEMNTKPELEIYADNVKCSHGTTTGQIDDTSLFYFQSRGLSESEANQLLMQAFVDEVADKIVDEKLQSLVKEKVKLWLQNIL